MGNSQHFNLLAYRSTLKTVFDFGMLDGNYLKGISRIFCCVIFGQLTIQGEEISNRQVYLVNGDFVSNLVSFFPGVGANWRYGARSNNIHGLKVKAQSECLKISWPALSLLPKTNYLETLLTFKPVKIAPNIT